MRLEEVHKEKVTKVSSINRNGKSNEIVLARTVSYIFIYLLHIPITYLGESKAMIVYVETKHKNLYLKKERVREKWEDKYHGAEHWCRNLCATTLSGDEGLE